MKIRCYKGPSLEALHEEAGRELGPEAVVVHTSSSSGIGSFLGRRKYELIAAVDGGVAEARFMSGAAKTEDIQKLVRLQNEKWDAVAGLYKDIQKDLKTARVAGGFSSVDRNKGMPEFASDWDPCFIQAVQSELPELFKEGKTASNMADLSRLLSVEADFPLRKRNGRPRTIALVGPTGSGKTTTLAKLAAKACMEMGLNVGLITLDTYRVAAIDQAREYATLLGIDLHVAFSAGEAARAMAELADKDIILVDTPGRNCRDRTSMVSLRGVLDAMGSSTVMLLIPASYSTSSVRDLLASFGELSPDYLVVTKVDEVRRFPVFTTAAIHSKCPVAFLTNGQRVPQDLVPANALDMAEMIVHQPGLTGPRQVAR